MFKRLIVIVVTIVLIIPIVGCRERDKNGNNTISQKQNSEEENAEYDHNGNVQPSGNEIEQQTTSAEYLGYNTKCYWSFVRKKDHLPPAFEKKEVELADKYKAIYLGDITKKIIYLTFDEGYENGYTSQILNVLKENNVKAAFFITMPYLKSQYELVDRMVKEGHTVGNHTVHHPSMPEVTDDKKLEDEMLGLDSLFKEKTGKQMKYLRPPKGEYSERTLKISKNVGYRNVFWSFAYADWNVNEQKGPDYAYKITVDNIHNGAVILLHAVSKDNAEALDRIIKDLKAQGYTFGTLDNL